MNDTGTSELIEVKQRRLRILQQQQATFGSAYVPPHIPMEITQIEGELRQLQAHQNIVRPIRLETERPARAVGLMALVSPERPDMPYTAQAAFAAIDYHRGLLRQCWLIASGGENGSLAAARQLAEFCRQRDINAYVWQVEDALNLQETYNLIDWLYTYDVPAKGLAEQDVIADITGATKPMSLGMLLACRSRRRAQYMAYQPQGPSQPLLLQISLSEGPPTEPRNVG